jgi:hypothetical protein
MGRVLKEATFEEWIEFVFARPVSDPAWYFESESDSWIGPPLRTVELITETLERSGEVLEAYDDAQVAQGLYLLGSACGDLGFALVDEAVAWPIRSKGLDAIYALFRDCFALRCSNHLSHLNEPEASPLNGVCYMWWDVFPAPMETEGECCAAYDELILSVLGRTLELPNEACQEAALHGLGHWHRRYPEDVEATIDRFIWANRKIRSQLRNYAYAARHGDIQ